MPTSRLTTSSTRNGDDDSADWVVHRVLPAEPFQTLDDYIAAGGGAGLDAARRVERSVVVDEVEASGLRGRGGAGFPTGTKWKTVMSYASDVLATTVVVNAAEGEPGTFKDRSILRNNPYAVIEGALIAAHVVGARRIVIATKATFEPEIARLAAAIDEVGRANWSADVDVTVTEGPSEYLYGEETALLEVLDGRPPFPRIAPPWRRGVDEVVADDADVSSESGLAADVVMATDDAANVVPPVLVDNVETLANVPAIVAKGAAWFREVGTRESPGTIVCTVTGAVSVPGEYEVAMGTPLRSVLELASRPGPEVTGDRPPAATPIAVLMGVSNAIVAASHFDTPVSYEGFAAIGSGLGSASFIVIGDDADPVAVAAGVSRFLAVESCGQCTPCKQDGLEISRHLDALAGGTGSADHLARIDDRLTHVADGARCSLATQHQVVITSLRTAFAGAFDARTAASGTEPAAPYVVAELRDLTDGVATIDESFTTKQPDWTHEAEDSGQSPVGRLTDHRAD